MAILGKTEEVEKEKEVATTAKGPKPSLRGILVQPRISEKANKLSALGKYVFVVHRNTNKIQVKKAVEGIYKVKVVQVNIITTEGKKRTYGRTKGKMSDFKKAIVTLKPGEKIEAGETV